MGSTGKEVSTGNCVTVKLKYGQSLCLRMHVSNPVIVFLLPLGCQDIADEFRAQEIDGQALLLLKEDHLMSAMNIKLGPALKICARINSLKES